jgi:hypothetical protein
MEQKGNISGMEGKRGTSTTVRCTEQFGGKGEVRRGRRGWEEGWRGGGGGTVDQEYWHPWLMLNEIM